MFLQHYLREQPFGVTPDPRYLYPSMAHREALASLAYSFESELGLASLIAEPGLGKTTVLYSLLERFGPSTRNVYIFETQCDSRELLRHILSDLACDTADLDMNAMFRRFRDLVAECTRAGRRVLIIIDEAQNLAQPVLETVRLLSNFETSSSKLVHIILAGQMQLAQMLARPEMAQLRQRITIAARLRPFSASEVTEYIRHRLNVAGYSGAPLFTPEALALITQQSRGIPREINRICFNAMSLGFALNRSAIDGELVQEASADLDFGPVLATSAPHVVSPEALLSQAHAASAPPRAPVLPRASDRRVLPPRPAVPIPERQPVNPRPVVTTDVSRSARPSTPATMTPGSSAVRPQSATASPESVRLKPQPRAARNAGAAIPVRGCAPERARPGMAVPQSQGCTGFKRAASVGTLLVALTVMAVVFGGRLRSAKGTQPAPPSAQPSALPGNRSATATADEKSVDVRSPASRADVAALRDLQARAITARKPIAHQTAPPSNSATADPTASAIKVPPPAAATTDAARDSGATPPPITIGASSIAMNPALLGPGPSNVPAPPMPNAATLESVSPGRLLTRVEPRYPAVAIDAHIQGSVVLSAHIGKDGRVTDVRTIKGNSLLGAAAADAVRQWVYTPYTLNGQAVEVNTRIVVKFAL